MKKNFKKGSKNGSFLALFFRNFFLCGFQRKTHFFENFFWWSLKGKPQTWWSLKRRRSGWILKGNVPTFTSEGKNGRKNGDFSVFLPISFRISPEIFSGEIWKELDLRTLRGHSADISDFGIFRFQCFRPKINFSARL